MTHLMSWERKGIRCVVARDYSRFIIYLGVRLGHPYYGLKRRPGKRTLPKKYQEAFCYAGPFSRQKNIWYFGLYLDRGKDLGFAIKHCNRWADKICQENLPQQQMKLEYISEFKMPER